MLSKRCYNKNSYQMGNMWKGCESMLILSLSIANLLMLLIFLVNERRNTKQLERIIEEQEEEIIKLYKEGY